MYTMPGPGLNPPGINPKSNVDIAARFEPEICSKPNLTFTSEEKDIEWIRKMTGDAPITKEPWLHHQINYFVILIVMKTF